METLEIVMKELEYSRKWLEYELIDEEYICKEYESYLESEDKNTEHYRYGSFKKLLKREDFFTDEKIKYYIELAVADNFLSTSAIVDLIRCKYLTDEQFTNLLTYLPNDNPILDKVYNREKLLRLLSRTTNLTQEMFDLMFSTADSVIHLALVERNDLSYHQLLVLSTSGNNKAIRNLARISLDKVSENNLLL